jgi:hypothetical protein
MEAGYLFENIIFGDSSVNYWTAKNRNKIFKKEEWLKKESFFDKEELKDTTERLVRREFSGMVEN